MHKLEEEKERNKIEKLSCERIFKLAKHPLFMTEGTKFAVPKQIDMFSIFDEI